MKLLSRMSSKTCPLVASSRGRELKLWEKLLKRGQMTRRLLTGA